MKPIEITIDVSKINKAKIKERKFTNKDGQEVTVKEYKMKVVPLKAEKFIKKGTTSEGKEWTLLKTHFVTESKDNKEEADNFLGDGVEFRYSEDTEVEVETVSSDDINPEDIPF